MMRQRVYQTAALLVTSFSLMLAIRDMLGVHDAEAVASLQPVFHDRLWGAVRVAMLFVGAVVAWWGTEKRPARLLAAALIGLSLNNNWWFLAPQNALLWPSVAMNYIGLGFGLASLLQFVTSLDDPTAIRLRRYTAWLSPLLGTLVAVFGTLWWTSVLVLDSPRPIFDQLFWLCWDVVNFLLVAISLALCIYSSPEFKARFGLIAASIAVAAAGTAVHGAFRPWLGDTVALNNIDTIAQIALPLGLGYSVLCRNAFGLNFYVRKALLFAIFGTILSFVFAIIEDLFKGWVQSVTATFSGVPIVELAVSTAAVMGFKAIEDKTDKFINHFKPEASGDETARQRQT
ncbi:MAG: hypothetical protein JO347_05700 [Candidatus Eremiobacteraeota bacterium]|nr:hypothetical protein [Candidatus Eremiobacteraeota bacterium]